MLIEFLGSALAILGAYFMSRNLVEHPNAMFYAFVAYFSSNIFLVHLAFIEGMLPLLIQQVLFITSAVIGLNSHSVNKQKVNKIVASFIGLTILSLSAIYFLSGKEFTFHITNIEILAAFFAISGSFILKTHNPHTRMYAFYGFIIADIFYIWIGFNSELYFFMIMAMVFIYTSFVGIINTQKLIKEQNTNI